MKIINCPGLILKKTNYIPKFGINSVGDTTTIESIDLNGSDISIYGWLQSGNFDPNAKDSRNGKNIFHYCLGNPNPAVFGELLFLIQNVSKEDIERLIIQQDDFGKLPLEYASKENAAKFSEEISKLCDLSKVNNALRAMYLPESGFNPPPSDINTPNSQEPISQNDTPTLPVVDNMVGNELPSNTTIPTTDSLDFGFEDAEIETKEADEENLKKIGGFNDIVGLDDVKERLMNDLIIPLKKENLEKLEDNNLKIENGFLFHGPAGCGKSAIIKAIGEETGLKIKQISEPADLVDIKAESAKNFKKNKTPTIVFIDDLDEKISKNVNTISNYFVDCAKNGVVLLASTNKYENIDETAIRVGCFDQHIEIPLPKKDDRMKVIKSVIEKEHKDIESQISEEDIEKLANATSGFSNSAMYYILNKAIKDQMLKGDNNFDVKAIRKVIEEYAKSRKIGKLMEENPTSVYDTFLKRSIIEYPKNFSEVAGMSSVKEQLDNAIVKRLQPDVRARFEAQNMPLFNDGFLFWGPPGCGKTFIAEALAGETKLPLYKMDKSTYDSSLKGESIKNIRKIFDQLTSKYEETGEYSILFVDEADTIFPQRGSSSSGPFNDEETNTMLQYLNNCTKKGIIPILATNFKDKLDTAVIRSGRIGTYIEIPTPDLEARIALFNQNIKDKEITQNITPEQVNDLAAMLEGFASSDITHIAKHTIDKALVNGVDQLTAEDFKQAIKTFAKERNLSTDFKASDKTVQYDTFKKREKIRYPKDFSDVAGMKDTKAELYDAIVEKLKPEVQERFKKNKQDLFTDGFLFFGKPGNGKTFIVEALAGETELPLYKITKADYETSLKGEAINNISKLFKQLELKFEKTGEYSLVFFDEADSIFPKRGKGNGFSDEETNLMLQFLNNAPSRGIIPILATNYKENIDDAVLRTGRVGRHIEIPCPDLEARIALFGKHIKNKEITQNITDEDIENLAKMLEGFTSSDIAHLAKTTINKALVSGVASLTVDDFTQAIKTFAKERDLAPDYSERDKTVQYDTFKKREKIKYPRDFSDVAGMDSTKQELKSVIVDKLNPEVQERFKKNGVALFTDGFMFYGKPGNGKTFIVEALAGETGLPLYKITKADYETSLKGEAINNISKLFKQLEHKYEKTGEYSLVFFDEADSMFPKRGQGNGYSDEETNLMLQFLNNAPSRGIIPILATNYSENIDSAVLRSGRIGKHIEIPSPDYKARKALFTQKIAGKEITKHITDDDISSLARMTNGFCAADVSHLTGAAIEKALSRGVEYLEIDDFKKAITDFSHERNMPEINDNNVTSVYDTVIKRTQIKKNDPKSLDDIGGMKEVKEALYESVILAFDPEIMKLNEENGIDLPNGVLLYGPPGCGKTFIMKAVASHAKLPLYQMKMSEIGSSYQHQTSENIKQVFDQLRNKYAKTGEASILFLDECDSFFSNSSRQSSEHDQDVNTLKEEMNNAGRDGIIIVAATNEIQNINPAILRDGRFDKKINVGVPDYEARLDIISKDLAKRKLTEHLVKDKDVIAKLAQISDGFATAQIVTAINDLVRKHIVTKKGGIINAQDIEKAFELKSQQNLKLQQDILERQFQMS